MKVLGGLSGITRKPAALAKFFLIAPELQRITSEADRTAGVVNPQRTQNHGLSQSVNLNQEKRINQLKTVLKESNPFNFNGIRPLAT